PSLTPAFLVSRRSRWLAHFFEHALVVVVQAILAVISDVQILPAVIVVVAHADSLSPARSRQTRFERYVAESAVMIIAIKLIGRRLSSGEPFQSGAIHDEDVGPAVVVIIENRNAGAGCLDDVLLAIKPAKHVGHGEAGFFGDISEVSERGWIFGGRGF